MASSAEQHPSEEDRLRARVFFLENELAATRRQRENVSNQAARAEADLAVERAAVKQLTGLITEIRKQAGDLAEMQSRDQA